MFKKWLIVYLGFSMLVVGFHYLAWRGKVRSIPPADFAKRAVELKTTEDMRYGYLLSWHGAFLVKTENRDLKNLVTEDEGTKPGTHGGNDEEQSQSSDVSDSLSDPDRTEEEDFNVYEAMRRELDLVPLKTFLEIVLYLTALLILFRGPFLLDKLRFLPACGPTWRYYWAGAISGAISFWVMAMPLIVLDYGPPLFSNWIGPGALSYSSGPILVSHGGGMTVSYRNMIETLIFWPGAFYSIFEEIIPSRAQDFIFFGIFAPFLYGGIWGMWTGLSLKKPSRERPLSLEK